MAKSLQLHGASPLPLLSCLQFYLVSNSSVAALAPGALPLKLLDPNYSTGDTNTVSKSIFEQFTEYFTG